MIPPSDSLGRTADVFPSKRHSPTAVTTQLLTLLLQFRTLIYPMIVNVLTSNKATANTYTSMRMRKMVPLMER